MIVYINGQKRNLDGDMTLLELLKKLGLNPDRVAVELNHNVVLKENFSRHRLQDEDRLEIVRFVGGG